MIARRPCGTGSQPVPLLPSGPGGVRGLPLRRTRLSAAAISLKLAIKLSHCAACNRPRKTVLLGLGPATSGAWRPEFEISLQNPATDSRIWSAVLADPLSERDNSAKARRKPSIDPAVGAAAGSFDPDAITRIKVQVGLAGKFFTRASFTNQIVRAESAVAAAVETPGGDDAAIGEQADSGIDQAFEFADETVPAARRATPAGVSANPILSDAQWIVGFERLDRRVECISHMSMQSRSAGSAGGSASAAGDGLVVGELAGAKTIVAADREIRHRARAGGWHAIRRGLRQRAEEHIDDALRGLDVAAGNRGGRERIDDRAGRRDQLDRAHQAGVGGHGLGGETLHHIESGGECDRVIGVDRAAHLRG